MYASVVVGVVSGAFFVKGGDPVEFPGGGPFGCGEDSACKDGDG